MTHLSLPEMICRVTLRCWEGTAVTADLLYEAYLSNKLSFSHCKISPPTSKAILKHLTSELLVLVVFIKFP